MNPLQIVNKLMNSPQVRSNPMAGNLFSMIQSGNVRGVEQFGRNIAKERGIDFDKAFDEFKRNFSIR